MPPPIDMSCLQVAELVTAFLDGALEESDRRRFEAHCRNCADCGANLGSTKLTVAALGRLGRREEREDEIDKDSLLRVFRTRGLHDSSSRLRAVPLGIAGQLAAPGDHIACFLESERDFDGTTAFLAAGLDQGEACILLGHDQADARILACLERAGFDPNELRRCDLLHTVSGCQPAEALLREIDDRVRAIVDRGVTMVRVLGNLGWGRPGWPSDSDILRLEAAVTGAIRRLPSIVVCSYDVRSLPGLAMQKGGMECHPLLLRGGTLLENEQYVPAGRFLETLGP